MAAAKISNVKPRNTRTKGGLKSLAKRKPKASEPAEKTRADIYFKDPALLDRVNDAVAKLEENGVKGASISSLVCLSLEKTLPQIEKARIRVRDVVFQDDEKNIQVTKHGKTTYVTVHNMQEGDRIQIGGDWFYKNKKGRVAKEHPRLLIERQNKKPVIQELGT